VVGQFFVHHAEDDFACVEAHCGAFYVEVNVLEVFLEVALHFSQQGEFLSLQNSVFVPIVDLECDENADDNQDDFTDGIFEILGGLAGLEESLADFSEKSKHDPEAVLRVLKTWGK